MKINNYFKVLLLAVPFCVTLNQAGAQLNSDENFVKRLPVFRWKDTNHYITYRSAAINKPSDEIEIDVISGKEKIAERAKRAVPPFTIKRDGTVSVALKNGKTETLDGIKNPTLSPDSNLIAFTKANDLYTLDLNSGKQWRITTDGSDVVYNGYSSWVYNEEILGRGMAYRAFWWSPDSKKIAFMRFDDSQVPFHLMTDDSGIHEKQISIRYPLPGDTNPSVRVAVAALEAQKVVWTDFDEKKDQYFGAPVWTPNSDQLWVQWMNRGQDTLKVESVNLNDGKHNTVYTETQKTWISLDQDDRIAFAPKKKMFLLMSDKDGWMHIYAHDMKGKLIKQLTKGNYTVSKINYIDDVKGLVYFTANRENSTRLDFYKVSLSGGEVKRLTFGDYMNRFELSPDASYFITTYSNFKNPARIALLDNNGKLIRELADSKGKDFEKLLPTATKSEIIRVPTSDGISLPVRIIFPVNIDPNKKYPILANVYGGPNSSMVSDGYFNSIPSANDQEKNELIRVTMDNRASGQFGKVGQNYIFRDLGYWEVEDYKTVIAYLLKKYPFIDASRIGISGFSYGGYISAMSILRAPEVFTAALAGGSVTDWHLYDSVYTERYMDTPKDNPKGYESSSLFTYAKNLKGHLSLAQGTMDDNVHMRNTIKLMDALQEARKQFEVMFYPGAAHGWYYLPNKSAYYNQANANFIKKYLLTEQVK